MNQLIALKFIERAEALGYKGKARDKAALDYFCGAATVLAATDHPEAQHVRHACVMFVSPRGYMGVVQLSKP